MGNEDIGDGYYKDKYGRWNRDRRSGSDRRNAIGRAFSLAHERRKLFRRKADRELLEKDHRTHIEEALEDFAEEHDGHL